MTHFSRGISKRRGRLFAVRRVLQPISDFAACTQLLLSPNVQTIYEYHYIHHKLNVFFYITSHWHTAPSVSASNSLHFSESDIRNRENIQNTSKQYTVHSGQSWLRSRILGPMNRGVKGKGGRW
ncbi:hypothetical protein GYMLUDRAFT_381388 [Collybiopsis luxurians FD-317 M1]|nr:hypothetical protein GYMLUDRAFT_381388 [Collybiopsis luxurians FD-317 M1]